MEFLYDNCHLTTRHIGLQHVFEFRFLFLDLRARERLTFKATDQH